MSIVEPSSTIFLRQSANIGSSSNAPGSGMTTSSFHDIACVAPSISPKSRKFRSKTSIEFDFDVTKSEDSNFVNFNTPEKRKFSNCDSL